ncbi:hypothetical protein IMG5_028980 [Ichthyophthirius multifiliis]|uniref:Transmembrane protein n=1 Tax=Ichthyophthirius multifiliis TaxID=5932 RepID=G0QLD4_ICHMU|nr:hypothetical protein IMG5_028980 [Ichthyophthirius multifiliis]EGR33980.1 hypothetical protein IMG5_028980 [Ichthyophthirius multifiliis]|eukprot:XP_004039284.1 hypothetical protein IMG5_028980 [Ichthyophthirius multifiliis]
MKNYREKKAYCKRIFSAKFFLINQKHRKQYRRCFSQYCKEIVRERLIRFSQNKRHNYKLTIVHRILHKPNCPYSCSNSDQFFRKKCLNISLLTFFINTFRPQNKLLLFFICQFFILFCFLSINFYNFIYSLESSFILQRSHQKSRRFQNKFIGNKEYKK